MGAHSKNIEWWLRCRRSKDLDTRTERHFPAAGAIKIPAAVLRSMIGKTGFAIASEESRYTLNGA